MSPQRYDRQILTVVVDVNVPVSEQNARRAGRVATISQRAMRHVTSGYLNGQPLQLALSFKMLDKYRDVLLKMGFDHAAIHDAADALVELMKHGPRTLDPYLVFGGTPDPGLKDEEDAGVLAIAFAAGADLLITDNLDDFAVGDCEVFKTSLVRLPDGKERQLHCQIHTRPGRQALIVSHPTDFVHWAERGFAISPDAVRARYPRHPHRA